MLACITKMQKETCKALGESKVWSKREASTGAVMAQKTCRMAASNAHQAVKCHALDNSVQHLQQSAAGRALDVG